jgi:hypothetical protein
MVSPARALIGNSQHLMLPRTRYRETRAFRVSGIGISPPSGDHCPSEL